MRAACWVRLLQVLKFNLDRKAARVRVFELGRVFLRDASVAELRHPPWKAFTSPCGWPGLAYGAAERCSGGAQEASVDFFDVKGDVKRCWPRCVPRFEPRHTRRCTLAAAPGAAGGQAIGHVGELHPQWRQPWDLPRLRCCSSWSWTLCCSACEPQFQAGAQAPGGGARPCGGGGRERDPCPVMAAMHVGCA